MQQLQKSNSKPSLPKQQLTFEAIGTHWQIDLVAADADMSSIQADIQERIGQFDATYSRFRADSWLSKLADITGKVQLPADALPLFELYEQMYLHTKGQVTPLIGQVLSDAGYDAVYSLQPKAIRKPPDWEQAMYLDAANRQLTLNQPVMLDVGAAGKGYLVDIVSELLEDHGIQTYCVDAGGDMRNRTTGKTGEPLRVGLEHPDEPGQVIGVADLGNQSLCGSAGNRRQWAGLHHIMSPHTLQPVREIKAVWVVADTTLLADGMATCLFFTQPDILRQYFGFSYTIIYADNSFLQSSDFPGQLFMAGQ
jgi:thiamine biosynthesis lipoprotein